MKIYAMKYLSYTLIILISGCCAFTSQDCDCEPPNPDLIAEALAWMEPYKTQSNFIFENNNGLLDTISVQFEHDSEYCGGEECGSDCKIERATLSGFMNYNQNVLISARDQDNIVINNFEQTDSVISVGYSLNHQQIYVSNDSTTAIYEENFEWNNQSLTVLRIDCKDPVNCASYTMNKLIVSEEKGLIEFELNSGEIWKKIN